MLAYVILIHTERDTDTHARIRSEFFWQIELKIQAERKTDTHIRFTERKCRRSPNQMEQKSFAFTSVWFFVLMYFVRERGFIVHWWMVVSLCYYILRCCSILCRVYLIRCLSYMFSFLFSIFVLWLKILEMVMIIMPFVLLKDLFLE